MAVFEIKNYLGKEEAKKQQPVSTEEPIKDESEIGIAKKEIQIVSIQGAGAASILIGNTLREVLENDGVRVVDRDDEASEIFKDVRFVSTDDIEKDLGSASRFAMESNTPLIIQIRESPSRVEQVFLNNISSRENVHYSFESFYEPISEEVNQLWHSERKIKVKGDLVIGQLVPLYGTLVFMNGEVCLFKDTFSNEYRVYDIVPF